MLYQVKAGILGLDELGREYAQLMKEHVKDLLLLGAAGRTQKELLFAKNDISLQYVYSDEKSLIENHDIDAVCIFGDPKQRPHLAIQAIEAGKHVFLADPMALNYDDAQALHAAASSKPSQVVMVSSFVRFDPLLQAVKATIDNGDIGMVNHISLDSSFFNGLNRKYSQLSGSAFLDSAIDEIDLCQWLLPGNFSIVEITHNNNTIICKAGTEKSSTINLIVQSELKKEQSYINIYGNKGEIIISNTNHRSFKLYGDDGLKKDVYTKDLLGFQFSEYLQLHHFTQAILGKQKKRLDSAHGVDIVKLAVAFEKAKVLDQKVEL